MDSSPKHFEQSSLNSPQASAIVPANASRLDYLRRLADVRQQIRWLQEEEAALEQELHRLAPVRRIPDDILREVFIHTLPRVVNVTPSNSPILLTHVCQRWRKVAIGFVLLWRQILINCRKPRGATQAAYELMQQNSIGSTFITLVGRSLTRLTLYKVPFCCITFQQESGLFPCLERLIISPEDSEESPDKNTPIGAFMDAPRLRYVYLQDWDWLVNTNQVDIRLPWQQLTHLLYMGDSVAYHIPLCPNLAYLHIELNEDDPDPWHHLSKGKHLKSLEGLFLYFPNDFHHPIKIFEKYEFPNLKSLRFEANQLPARREAHDYFHKALSGFSHLTHLSLRCREYGQVNLDGIRSILEPASNIRTLDIELQTPLGDKVSDDEDDWDRFFKTLAWNDHRPEYSLVPQLQTLIIRPQIMVDAELEQPSRPIPMKPHFLAFISTRMVRPVEQRLRRIVAYLTHPLDHRSIKQYIDGGLEYAEYPARETIGQSDTWMDDDPALYDWPELQRI